MNIPQSESSLAEWLQWLEELHPSTIDLGLERVNSVFGRLALDLGKSRIVLVGGTNGKGSSVAMFSGILRAAGHSTGCYTSPHLLVYNERLSLNGRMVDDTSLCAAFARVESVRDGVSLTYFEYGTLAALVYFAAAAPDYIILEVGLGGRLDAVNIVSPELSLVTNVALDHLDWLGDTREKIGYEKAGIFRSGKPAIYGESDIPDSVREAARQCGAQLFHKGEHYQWQASEQSWQWQGVDAQGGAVTLDRLPLNDFPLDNAAGVLQALQLLDASIPVEAIRSGLAAAQVPGRFQ
ncbi:MAG TPA: bifunctional tetrahydrofolate synthase/dihydrofolate synthase, partial [Pseudomonadaceae bacterium]|nr:bifunctional tetrahydrofolate synthase/dihydrofolate synthase [Pseudomonadaceae bacterium]